MAGFTIKAYTTLVVMVMINSTKAVLYLLIYNCIIFIVTWGSDDTHAFKN